jgi:hypothetical protein
MMLHELIWITDKTMIVAQPFFCCHAAAGRFASRHSISIPPVTIFNNNTTMAVNQLAQRFFDVVFGLI